MELLMRQITEVFKLSNGKYVICMISIAPRSMIYYHKQNEPHMSYRWLRDVDWAAFDSVIESLVLNKRSHTFEKCLELSPSVQLKVESITKDLSQICQTVSGKMELKVKNVAMAFKCELKYSERAENGLVNDKSDQKTSILKDELIVPACEKGVNDCKMTEKKVAKTPTALKIDEDLDAQIQSFHIVHKQHQDRQQELGGLITPSSSASLNALQDIDQEEETRNSVERSITKTKKRQNVKRLKASPVEESCSSTPSPLLATRQRRTISKPKRFHEFVMQPKCPKSPKTATTDDDDEEDEHASLEQLNTPKTRRKLPANSQTVITKPLKTPKSTQITTTMGKRSATPNTYNRSLSLQQRNRKIELLGQKEYQKDMQELIKDLIPTSPPKVKCLTLNDMTLNQVMDTLEALKPRLDALFKDISHKDFITNHDGIDHFLVIDLVPAKIKIEMMKRLGELYEKDDTPKFGSHILNVLLPEWILNLFIKRYKMPRDEAIKHLRVQNCEHLKLAND